MLHPAFGVMRPEELVFILANSARRGIREPSVIDSIRKLSEGDLPPQPFSIPASRTHTASVHTKIKEGYPQQWCSLRTRALSAPTRHQDWAIGIGSTM
jgi:hypothetical protein